MIGSSYREKVSNQPKWTGYPNGVARILVSGVGGNVGQGILKALDHVELASWVVGTDCDAQSAGLHCVDKGYLVPPSKDEAFLERIIYILNREQIDLMFVGSDQETLALAKICDAIEKKTAAKVIVSSAQVVEICNDKWRTAQWFNVQQLPHPDTVLITDLEGTQQLLGKHGWPLVIKDRHGFASRSVWVIDSQEQLDMYRQKLGDSGIVQQHIGTDEQEYTAAVFCSKAGQADAVLLMKRDLLAGTSYRITPYSDTVVEAQIKHWAKQLGAEGPVNFQYRLTRQGPICFEINCRFSGTTGVRYLMNFNDAPMAVRHHILQESIIQPTIKPIAVLRYWAEVAVPQNSISYIQAQHETG
jgi:carbamoyl-phosphate synthase large subunit